MDQRQHHLQEPGDKAKGKWQSWEQLAESRVGEKADSGAPDSAQLSAKGKGQMPLRGGSRRRGLRPGLGQETEVSLPSSSFSPRKVLHLPLTFLMWSRNSGEERQSSELENWRQLYWKRGSRSGSRSNSLWVEARCQPWGVAPAGSMGPGCPAAGEGGQSLGCELSTPSNLARTPWPALPVSLSHLFRNLEVASWKKQCVPRPLIRPGIG